jgi:hypothetical protein
MTRLARIRRWPPEWPSCVSNWTASPPTSCACRRFTAKTVPRDARWPPWTPCLPAPATNPTSGSRPPRPAASPTRSANLVILSRFPLVDHPRTIIRDSSGPRPAYRVATADPPDQTADPLEWERPILYTQVDLGDGRRLHVLNLHLKSKLATDIPGQKLNDYTWKTPAAWAEGFFISSMKRVGQALQVRLELDRLFTEADQAGGPAPLIAVCGDFNADSGEVPVQRSVGRWRTPATPPMARG